MALAAAKTCDVFWAPFKLDCEELLSRFQQTESVRYEEFAAIWRAMDFSSVFYGMITNNEKRPFTRLAFTTVYGYFLAPHSFQIRVGALYMFYGLYLTQPSMPKEKIWIALKDWMCVQQFVSDAITCQHLDVLYVFRKLASMRAFFYTAMPNELKFDAKRRYKNKKTNELFQDHPARVTQLVNTGTLEEITNVQAYYDRIKQALQVSTSVSMTPINLAERLQECALEFQQWHDKVKKSRNRNTKATKAKESPESVESSNRADLLAAIKSKTYGHLPTASKSRRHRQVEMDTSESGTDHVQESLSPRRRRFVSLRKRTCKTLGKTELEEEKQQHWLLSTKEEDKAALKRPKQKNRFKW